VEGEPLAAFRGRDKRRPGDFVVPPKKKKKNLAGGKEETTERRPPPSLRSLRGKKGEEEKKRGFSDKGKKKGNWGLPRKKKRRK